MYMVLKQMKKCSTLQLIKEMQIKPKLGYFLSIM